MQTDKYISLADCYFIDNSDKTLTRFVDALKDGKVNLVLSTKNQNSPSVNLTEKSLRKYVSK